MSSSDCIELSTDVKRSPRLIQLAGMYGFDIFAKSTTTINFPADVPPSTPWKLGCIVGPSGSGKSTLLRHMADVITPTWDDRSVVENFPDDIPLKDVCGALTSVGFSSTLSWVRPFSALSNGEQYRANLARTLLSSTKSDKPQGVDEFTSVVDRTVGKIGAAALRKALSSRIDGRIIVASCHFDILEWLQPDWIVTMPEGTLSKEGLQRPEIVLEIRREDRSMWRLFGPFHYLDHGLPSSARLFVARLKSGEPVAATAVSYFTHPHSPAWRVCRVVVLPDYQGIGIGNRMADAVAGVAVRATNMQVTIVMSHPAMVVGVSRSSKWKCTSPMKTNLGVRDDFRVSAKARNKPRRVATRMTASFRYVGPPANDPALARQLWDGQ